MILNKDKISLIVYDFDGVMTDNKAFIDQHGNEMVKVNNKVRKDEDFPVQVFDVLNLDKAKLNYKLEIVNRKFKLVEVSAKEADSKIVKIIGKRGLKLGNRKYAGAAMGNGKTGKFVIQMNLDDGQNIITAEKFSVGDSVLLNTKEDKIVKVLPLKVGAKVEVVLGKHAGEKGELVGFEELVRGRNYEIKLEDKTVRLPYKTILVIG